MAKVFPAVPAFSGLANEPAEWADDEDATEANESRDVAIGSKFEEVFFDCAGAERLSGDKCNKQASREENLPDEEEDDKPEKSPPTIPCSAVRCGWG